MKSSLTLFLLLLSFSSMAQEKTLPMDERGMYTFLEVTELQSVRKEVMSANAKRFFKANAKAIKLKTTEKDTAFYGKGKMVVQKGSSGIGHPSAEVNYNISLELKENKYRLILTDFVVTPYERDRYGNFVPVTVSLPLERSPGKLNRAEWDRNMANVVDQSAKLAQKLKTAMSNTVVDPKPETKKPNSINTTTW